MHGKTCFFIKIKKGMIINSNVGFKTLSDIIAHTFILQRFFVYLFFFFLKLFLSKFNNLIM
jgi:hypothetical protein